MPINQQQANDNVDISNPTTIINYLLDNPDEAAAYSQDPIGYVEEAGWAGADAHAVAECGVSLGYGPGGSGGFGSGSGSGSGNGGGGGGGGGASAYASASADASAVAAGGAAGVAAAINPAVYNYYTINNEDNSTDITNNILANGDVTVDNTVQNIHGDGNTTIGGDVSDSQVQTGSGIQSGGDTDITDSNVATGDDNQQAIDNSTTDSHDTTAGGDAQGGEDNTNVMVDEPDPVMTPVAEPDPAADAPDGAEGGLPT
jgi:hypothetical protein